MWCTLTLNLRIYLHQIHLPFSSAPHIRIVASKRKEKKEKNMESCFLTSTSFAKTTELVPSIKARPFSYPKRSCSQLQFKRVGLPSSITCCHLSSSSSSESDSKPFLEADWRSFRARLVAGEQALSSTDPSSTVVNYQTPQVTLGDKWVHTIHEPEKGCLLIATEKLDGVHIFERTVILLLSTGPVGPYGIILNRPSLMSIKEMRSSVIASEETFSERPLFFGGPLEEGLFLVSPKGAYDYERVARSGVFEEVMKGLYYGSKESVGCAAEMVKRNVVGIGDFRFFDGYCGWEMEQLREEVIAGYWTVAACSASLLGLHSAGSPGLWEEVHRLMGPKKVW